MDEESEEVTMIMAGDVARHRRTDDVRRRHARASTDDKFIQTDPAKADPLFPLLRAHTTMLCYMGFALVIGNLSQLKLLIAMGSSHRNYTLVIGLLLCSLFIQCSIASVLIYVTRKEMTEARIDSSALTFRMCKVLNILISCVIIINICVFLIT